VEDVHLRSGVGFVPAHWLSTYLLESGQRGAVCVALLVFLLARYHAKAACDEATLVHTLV